MADNRADKLRLWLRRLFDAGIGAALAFTLIVVLAVAFPGGLEYGLWLTVLGFVLLLAGLAWLISARLSRVERDGATGEELRGEIERRQRVEAELLDEHTRMRAILDSATDALFIVIGGGIVQAMNPALTRLFGWTEDEIVGRNVDLLLPELFDGKQADRLQILMASARSPGTVECIYNARRRDGSTFPASVTVSVYTINGHPRCSCFVRDVSERLVGELNEFNYMASHDLQEPLRTMSTYCGLLSQDVGNPKRTAEDIAAILDASLRMQRLITNLLDYSRAGDAKIRRVPVDLAAVMHGVSRDLQNRMAEGEGSLQWDRLPTVPGDEVQLSRLFQNLVANGLKFHRPGVPPVVQVSAESMNGDVRITVRDNGIGIDPKHFSQIFKPFRRLHGADKYEGTGIGLSICRKIVEQHGGRIDVNSQAGEGCSFVVTLPLEDSADGRNR